MTDTVRSVDNFGEAVEAATSALRADFAARLKIFSENLFAKYPGLESFGWTQYTPYFMDGDPCVFGIKNAQMNGSYCEVGYYDMNDAEYFDGMDDAMIEIESFLKNIRKYENALLTIFGDHALITIRRDGELEVTKYSHE